MATFVVQVVGSLPGSAQVGVSISDIHVLLGRTSPGQPTAAQVSCFLFAADSSGRRLTGGESPLPTSIIVGTQEDASSPERELVRFRGIQFRFAGSFRLGVSVYQIARGRRIDYGTFLLGGLSHRVEVTA